MPLTHGHSVFPYVLTDISQIRQSTLASFTGSVLNTELEDTDIPMLLNWLMPSNNFPLNRV